MPRTGRPKTGSIREHPPGSRSWQVRWTENGKQRAKGGFTSKTKARAWLQDRQSDLNNGRASSWDASKRSFGHYADAWLKSRALKGLKPRTLQSYRKILDFHLLPEFVDEAVTDLDRSRWQTYFAELTERGLAPRTLRNIRTVAHGVMKEATRDKAVVANPLSDIDLPSASSREITALDAAQVRTLVDALPEHWRLPVLTAGSLGLRAGETWALRLRSIDLLHGTLRVDLAVSEVDGELVFHEPKSDSSKRTLALPAFLVEHLRALIERRIAQGAGPDDPLFLDPNGEPVRHMQFYESTFRTTVRRLVKTGTFPRCNFHSLRHSAASILISAGYGLQDVKERLGHSAIAMTSVYSHMLEARDREVAAGLDKAFARPEDSNVVPLRKENPNA